MRNFLKKILRVLLLKVQGISWVRMILARFTSGVEITEADETDLVGVMLWRNPDDPDALQRDRSHITDFVAKKGGKIIGHIQLCRHSVEGHPLPGYWLSALLVRTLYRGRRVGEELSCAVNRKASEEGADRIFLLVSEKNRPAIKLYEKLGFKKIILPEAEPQLDREALLLGYRRIVMVKSLREA